MNIKDEYLDALKDLGYTETEARFLYIVGTHSGYFTATQFRTFTGLTSGKRSYRFTQKVIVKKHATLEVHTKNARVYHLFSRKIYALIGKENIRNRRNHEFQFTKTRLAALDFILANQGHVYFETEKDKVQYFCEALGIEKHSLPAKLYLGQKSPSITSRYFVDKFPMFLPARGTPAVVTFTYVESEAENLAGFMTHLQNYMPLFRKLGQFAFLFISPYGELFPKARGIFTSLVKNPLELPTTTELVRYFRIRRAWEAKQFAQLTNADIEFLNEATHRFHAQRFQDLYQSWNRGNLEESTLGSMFAGSNGARQVRFDTYLVKPQAFLSRSLGGRG